jgi:hypothetical protein
LFNFCCHHNVDKENSRKQAMAQLHERRKQVIRLHTRGVKVIQIVDLTGLSYPAVRAAIDRHTSGGNAANKPARRGVAIGAGRSLTDAQEWAMQRFYAAEADQESV